ncbi:hypothetical protein ACFYZJ_17260 [Streptomyces sp. NPDC001848]|uniref:hypothetical protein n=1 Tax=Streptomyces sp. NPDC001848 TaxID=3364618 RepID=UPI003688162B
MTVLDACFDITASAPGAALAQAVDCAAMEGAPTGACVFLAASRRLPGAGQCR